MDMVIRQKRDLLLEGTSDHRAIASTMKPYMASSSFINALPSISFLRDSIAHSIGHGGHGGAPFSWKDLLRFDPGVGLTLLGAGTLGALLLLRQISPSSLSWLVGFRELRNASVAPDLLPLTVPGLRNVGNNCFLNSILQALASSDAFLSYLAATNTESVAPYFQGIESSCPTMLLTDALSSLLGELSILATETHVANPLHVMLALEPYLRGFDLASQQDAAEVLDHLATILQEERLALLQGLRAYAESLVDASKAFNDMKKSAFDSWRQQSHWPMEGSIGSSLTCQECGFQFSTQFESFHDVPLPPPRLPNGNTVDQCTVEDCLKNFTAPECISGVRCNRCSHYSIIRKLRIRGMVNKKFLEILTERIKVCAYDDDCSCEAFVTQEGEVWRHVYVNAFKQLKFGRCPEVLCFHMQRAIMNGSGDLIKWRGHVSFPLLLNLHPYTVSAQCHVLENTTPFRSTQVQTEFTQNLCPRVYGSGYELDSNFYKAPVSLDESTSDDTHLSISSSSDDSASDDSFDSISRRVEEPIRIPEAIPEVEAHTSLTGCRSGAPQPEVEGPMSLFGCSSGAPQLSKSTKLLERNFFPYYVDSARVGEVLETPSVLSKLQKLGSILPLQMALGHNPFLHAPMPTDFVQTLPIAAHFPSNNLRSKPVGEPYDPGRYLFELIAVVIHHGTPKSGHYTVYRRAKFRSDGTSKDGKHILASDGCENLYTGGCSMAGRTEDGLCDTLMAIDASRGECIGGCSCNKANREACEVCVTELGSGFKDVPIRSSPAMVASSISDATLSQAEETGAKQLTVDKVLDTPMATVEVDTPMATVEALLSSANVEQTTEALPKQGTTVLWFRVSDSQVDIVTEDEVLTAQASLLFYERCQRKAY